MPSKIETCCVRLAHRSLEYALLPMAEFQISACRMRNVMVITGHRSKIYQHVRNVMMITGQQTKTIYVMPVQTHLISPTILLLVYKHAIAQNDAKMPDYQYIRKIYLGRYQEITRPWPIVLQVPICMPVLMEVWSWAFRNQALLLSNQISLIHGSRIR